MRDSITIVPANNGGFVVEGEWPHRLSGERIRTEYLFAGDLEALLVFVRQRLGEPAPGVPDKLPTGVMEAEERARRAVEIVEAERPE